MLGAIKPVLRRNCFHLGQNVIVSWRSFEVWLVQQGKSGFKAQNPIYVPLLQASEYNRLGGAAIEAHVVRSLKQRGAHFSYEPEALRVLEEVKDELPEELHTSLFLQASNQDFEVVICSPTIEYNIPSANFSFVKQLTRAEYSDFVDSDFESWSEKAIRKCAALPQFKNLLANRSQRQGTEPGQMAIYKFSEFSGEVTEYNSVADYRQKRLLKSDTGSLSGCMSRNGHLGKIEVSPFQVTIKGLDSDFDFCKSFGTAEWGKLVGFLQAKTIANPAGPTQLVERVTGLFRKFLQTKKSTNFSLDGLITGNYSAMSDAQIERAIAACAAKVQPNSSAALQQVTDLKNPDGLTS